jgi:hypothetical protein
VNVFARVEAACANVVERAFAVAFPSALEPVQIARKLVLSFEAGAATSGRSGLRFVVRVSPADFARFSADREYLECQWRTMLGRLAERSRRPQRSPDVTMEADPRVSTGTVAIASETRPDPVRLALRVRRGVPPGARLVLDRPVTIGRDPACDLVLVDPRVSRRHASIEPEGGALRLRDLGSSNGLTLNGADVRDAELGLGDVVRAGDTELVVEDVE